MEQVPNQPMPVDQPKSKNKHCYLDELCAKAQKYFENSPQEAEVVLEGKVELNESGLASYLADKPYLQQKLAEFLDYSPNRWLLMQEAPEVIARRKLHRRSHVDYDPKAADPNAGNVYDWAARSGLQGICFSGGGIRSATLNLGVLQGLAKLGMLNHFDYLSSVSGGGYIHEWFAAWITREEEEQKRAGRTVSGGEYIPGSGFKAVEQRLVPLPSTKEFPTQPEPVRWLRRYSNYLTPQKGLFTGDTWVAVAIWLRNTFLNQIILISGLFALLLSPYLIEDFTFYLPPFWSIVASVALFLVAASKIAIELQGEHARIRFMDDHEVEHQDPEAPRRWGGEKTIQAFVVLPLLLACVLYLPVVASVPGVSLLNPWAQDIGVFVLLWGLVVAAASAGGGVEAYMGLHGLTDRKKESSDQTEKAEQGLWTTVKKTVRIAVVGLGGLVIANAALSALAGTLLFIGVRSILRYETLAHWLPASLLPEICRVQLAFGPPLLFAVPFFAIVIGAGLVGRDFPDWLREWLARVRAWALLFGLGWGVFFGIALLGPAFLHWLPIKFSAAVAWLGTTAGSVLAGKSTKTSGKPVEGAARSVPLNTLAKVGAYVFILGLLLVLSLAAQRSIEYVGLHISSVPAAVPQALQFLHLGLKPIWVLLFLSLAIFGLFGWRVDVNDFSLNPFYRNRLTRCYLGATNRHRAPNPLTGFDDRDTRGLQISRLTPSQGYTGPFPIICTAINLSFGQDLAWQERKAASFAFTPLYTGYYVGWTAGKPGTTLNCCGFVPTASYAFPNGGINISTAVAISGAAASPNWGYHTDPATAFLMTIFNVRLGWWLFNPRRPETQSWASPRFAPLELTKELLGMVDDTSKFVYLSDGGHFDNMGLYELVRRRCYRIVICDTEQDEDYRFEGIANAIRKCRIDFGAEITLDLTKLRQAETTGNCQSHWASGRIRYPETPDNKSGQEEGIILYIKSSLTGVQTYKVSGKDVDLPNEPVDIINYKLTHQTFPHDTTANQWFTESQFESYRRLGYHVIEEVHLCEGLAAF
jgi:hypothetical protein